MPTRGIPDEGVQEYSPTMRMSMTRRLVLAVAVLGLLAGRARADIVVAAAGVTAGPETATVALAGFLMSWLAVQGWVTRTKSPA